MNLNNTAYYLSKVTSQYQNAPKMLAWLTANLQMFQDAQACLLSFATAFDIATAVGAQLDVIGAILGQPRVVGFQPTGIVSLSLFSASFGTGYVVGDHVTIVQSEASNGIAAVTSVGGGGAVNGISVFGQGNGYSLASSLATTGGTGTGLTVNITATVSPVLDDTTYRTLLYATIAKNHWNGLADSLQPTWATLFPGGGIAINDGQNMTATVILSGAFTSIIQDLIVNGYIVPRPQGVRYTYTFPSLPMLGYDLSNAVLAGWDTGHYT